MIKIFILSLLLAAPSFLTAQDQTKPKYDVFSFNKEVTLPGTPEIIFDAVTGDISGWWDHSMSEEPREFYIEPFPGGGFYEIFDDEGNGVLHARVIYAERGKLLRFDGPLGLSGKAIQVVTTYQFEPVGTDSTLFKLSVHAAGEVDEGIPAIVEKVWEHFIFEQLEPYIKAGKHLEEN
jgi:uncharacterized protein YndB with AHSA1/START domain